MATVTKNFAYTGSSQPFRIPGGVTSVRFRLWGAPGGLSAYTSAKGKKRISGATGAGAVAPDPTAAHVINHGLQTDASGNGHPNALRALGGYIEGVLAVIAGAVYNVYVGGGGGHGGWATTANGIGGPGGFNGGGDGGGGDGGDDVGDEFTNGGGGGGGATDIRTGSSLSSRILVAGGGGGSSSVALITFANPNVVSAQPNSPRPYGRYEDGSTGVSSVYIPTPGGNGFAYGGPGGSSVGGTAQSGGRSSRHSDGAPASGSGGGGGSGAIGGSGGVSSNGDGTDGSNGALGVGGDGAQANRGGSESRRAGGGGGGGFFGGGGGSTGSSASADASAGGGGGGGSNYADPSFTAVVSLKGIYPVTTPDQVPFKAIGCPNGRATLTYIQPPNTPTIVSPDDGGTVNVAAPLLVDWGFSSRVSGQSQKAYDLDYKLHSSGTWTSFAAGKLTSATQATIPASTFITGDEYDIRVRVYDRAGDVSDYSEISVFAVTVVGAPVITAPTTGQIESSTSISVAWTDDLGVDDNVTTITVTDDATDLVDFTDDYVNSRINLCTNPSFEANTNGWDKTGGGSISRVTTWHEFGAYALQGDWEASSDFNHNIIWFLATTTPGQWYWATIYVLQPSSGMPDVQLAVSKNNGDFDFYALGDVSDFVSAGPTTWVPLTVKFQAISDTSCIAIYPTSTPVGGDTIGIDALLLEAGNTDAPSPYFDGTNANGTGLTVSWQGTTDNSISQGVAGSQLLAEIITMPDTALPGTKTLTVAYSTITSEGFQSPPDSVDFIYNIDPPTTPTISNIENGGDSTISFKVNFADDTVVTLDIYRTDVTNDGDPVRVSTQTIASTTTHIVFTDPTLASNTVYHYTVRAFSAVGGFAEVEV